MARPRPALGNPPTAPEPRLPRARPGLAPEIRPACPAMPAVAVRLENVGRAAVWCVAAELTPLNEGRNDPAFEAKLEAR